MIFSIITDIISILDNPERIMIKILHTADLHLDSPFSLKDPETAQAMRRSLRGTFTSAMLFARSENVDIVLISGDVFDTGFASRDTLNLLKSEFEKNPGIRFVIAPGNHDPYTENSPWAKTEFPPNVHIFKSSALNRVSFDDINTDVYGWAFTADTMTVDPLAVKPYLDQSKINILCAHCDIDGPAGGRYCSISKAELEAAGFDYAALGHIHKGSETVRKVGKVSFAYPGCLEGRSFDECGQKYALCGRITKEHGLADVELICRPFSQRRFEIVEADVTDANDTADIISAAEEAMKAARVTPDVSVRLILCGKVSPSLIISEPFIESSVKGARYVEVCDRTEPLLDYDSFGSDPGIRGAFYRSMKPYLTEGGEREKRIAAKALHAALQALDGSN